MQISYNISVNTITEQISFFVNHSYNLKLFLKLKEVKIWVEKANVNISKLHVLYQKLWTDIKFLMLRSAFYHNKYHAEVFILKKRNKVYLL